MSGDKSELASRSRPLVDVGLLTERRYTAAHAEPDDWYLGNILQDDALLAAALERLELTSARLDWADPTVDWSSCRCCLFRTTWDYFERIEEFRRWLRAVRGITLLCNSAELVEWNLDKHYLADLHAGGIPVVETRFIERGSGERLTELLSAAGWERAVLKPCVSGAARHTYLWTLAEAGVLEPIARDLLKTESLMMQPFQRDVLERGEDALVVIDGRYSHAVRKRPKPGDFRVQDDHGGTVERIEPTGEQIALAERAMAACPEPPVYGRVDMVRNDRGELVVMELELIEPELWLRFHAPSADLLASALARWLETRAV